MSREDRLWENQIREEHEEIFGSLDKIPMEDKLLIAMEEQSPAVRELTPGEISRIVNRALRDLPENLIEESGAEISEVCFNVAYKIMQQITE